MLTVKQINEVSFGKAGFSGYKPEDVDNFIDEVAASFQQLEAERDDALKRSQELAAKQAELSAKNAELQEKLSILAQKIESYREDEDGIKDALLSAQRLAKESVQGAKDKAEIILQDAQNSAREILDNAKIEASQAAKEYMAQADEKKEELEEIKRQVSAFRASLLEMYKKHLESINHIPNFRQKEKAEEVQEAEAASAVEEAPAQPAPVQAAPVQAAPVEPAAPVVQEPEPQPVVVQQEAAPQPRPQPQRPAARPASRPAPQQDPARHHTTLHDKVDFNSIPAGNDEDDFADEDLSGVGIDLKTYSNIPETLQREKSSHFSHLEFGDDVDLGNKKRKK